MTWKVRKVVSYLGNMSMENLKVVSVRTAALLSIFCGQAPVETITDLNISNIALEKNYIFISIEDD